MSDVIQFRNRAAMDVPAFQEQLRGNHCWGCGTLNELGLQIKSYWAGDEAICAWDPKPCHSAGPKHVLNGGIIATVIDCHCVCTAIAAAYRPGGREIGTEPAAVRFANGEECVRGEVVAVRVPPAWREPR